MNTYAHTHDIEDIATRIYDLLPPWDKEADSMDETIKTLDEDPLTVVEYLLTMVEELNS